jgi:type II secretory pathway pseudopilin PulG
MSASKARCAKAATGFARGTRTNATAGFSLLEALIALGIAAVCLVAIFDLQRQLVEGQRRYEAAAARAEMRRNALTMLRDVVPGTTTSGQLTAPPGLTVSWTATPISDQKINNAFPTGTGNFSVQLYRVQAQVLDGRGRRVDQFTIERLGWVVRQTTTASGAARSASTTPGGRGGAGRPGRGIGPAAR